MNNARWGLVKRVCAWEPADRISINKNVIALQKLEEEEKKLDEARDCAEHIANNSGSESEPVLHGKLSATFN